MSSQSSAIPGNVVFYPDAADDFRRLDRGRKIKVVKALRKISSAPLEYGKALGNQHGQALASMRSAYVDNKSLRIVWFVTEAGEVQIVVVAGIAKRDEQYVYRLVASRREGVKKFTRAIKGPSV